MKNKMIITSIIYVVMLSCTHITFPMDDANQLTQPTPEPRSPRRTSLPLIFYSKIDNRTFKPFYDTPNTGSITLQADSADYQGHIKEKEDGNYEIYRTSTKDPLKTVAFRTISPENFNTLKTTINKDEGDIYIQPISKSNTFLKLNKDSLPTEKLSIPVFTQGQATPMPSNTTKAAIGYVDAEDILRQQYQKEDNDHARQQVEKKQKDAQDQFSRSSSSDELPPTKIGKGSSSHLRLPKQTADEVITTPEGIRSRHSSPTQSSSGTQSSSASDTNSSASNSGDASPITTPLHTTSPASSSAKLLKNAPSEEAVTDALNALSASGDIIDDNKDLLEDESQKNKSTKFPIAEQAPSTTLRQLEEAEKILDQNEDMIEQALEPIVGATAAQMIVTGAETALDIAQDLLTTDIISGRPLLEMIDDFATLPCYDIITTTTNDNSTLSIKFADNEGITKTISVALLQTKKPITPTHLVIENNEGDPAYVLKYTETTNKSEQEINPKKDSLPTPYYKQYPGRVLAGSMSILAAFIMVAYHYDHLPESMMGILDQLRDLLYKNMPFTQSL